MIAMGFKLVDAVYRLDRNVTTPSEQAVLLALAFRANDKTLLCYPKQETLAEMTHLSRSTVALALNKLKRKGILDWRSGGPAKRRGKFGQVLANDYSLKLPKSAGKDKKQGPSNVRQPDMGLSDSRTQPCPTIRHGLVRQTDMAMSDHKTPTEETTEITSEKILPIPNIRESGAGLDFDKALKSMGIEVPSGKRPHRQDRSYENSPLLMALHVCGIESGTERYRNNYKAFSKEMMKLGMERSMEIVRTFASELRQGELDDIDNLPALLMFRLQQDLG